MSKKFDIKRYVSIIFILIVTLPALFITRYAGEPGRYIGSTMFVIIAMLGIWEVLTSMGFNKYLSVFVASAMIPFFLLEFNEKFHWIVTMDNNIVSDVINWSLTWMPFVILIAMSFIPVVVETHVAKSKMGIFTSQLSVTLVMVLAGVFFKTIWAVNTISLTTVFYLLLIAIISDSMGYFGGKFLGKKLFRGAKLAPKLSPKKTWAGAVIGFVFGTTFAILYGYYMGVWDIPGQNEVALAIVMGILLPILSPIGDLLFSGIKRKAGVKDFSNLLPGHGGVFDRFDAMSLVTFAGAMTFVIFK